MKKKMKSLAIFRAFLQYLHKHERIDGKNSDIFAFKSHCE